MTDPNFVILYVKAPSASTAFYADVLGRAPVEASATFAMFALSSGVMLGLWSRDNVAPAAAAPPGGAELAIAVPDAEAVRTVHADWCRRKLTIAQAPTAMDFGYTFLALDPDGHRLRVFAPAAP
jgi:catechol 2,3-dioxygenase-like lactoylglutathione lyase family enzyme